MPLEICRVCGDKNNLKYLIFPGNENLLEILRVCANIVIAEKDVLPKYICDSCEQGLKFSYRLRKIGEETDRKLREELIVVEQEQADADTEDAKELDEKIDDDELFFEDVEEICDEYETFYDDGLKIEKYEVEEQDVPAQQDDAVQRDDDADCEEVYAEDFDEDTEDGNDTVSNDDEIPETAVKPESKDSPSEVAVEKLRITVKTGTIPSKSDRPPRPSLKHFDAINYSDKWKEITKMVYVNDNKEAFLCTVCQKVNQHRHAHIPHCWIHTGERPFECNQCEKTFRTWGSLYAHVPFHSKERHYVCDICEKSFKHQTILHRHKKTHLEVKPHKCRFCSASFIRREDWVRHENRHEIAPTHVCTICHAQLADSKKLEGHMELEHLPKTRKRPFKCPQCPTSFSARATLIQHVKVHYDKSSVYQCSKCSLLLKDAKTLEKHEISHSNPYRCNNCDEAFPTEDSRLIHRRNVHLLDYETFVLPLDEHKKPFISKTFSSIVKNIGDDQLQVDVQRRKTEDDEYLYKCPFCTVDDVDHVAIDDHLKLHTTVPPVQCTRCNEQFADKTKLRNHKLMMHNETKQYICDVCGFVTIHLSGFISHTDKHNGTRRYKCDFCTETFADQGQMKMHAIMRHVSTSINQDDKGIEIQVVENVLDETGKGQFKCHLCGNRFEKEYNLKRHIKRHAEPLSECFVCHKKFTTKKALKSHELIHRNEWPFSCPFCGKGFRTNRKLNDHVKIHTGEMPYACDICPMKFRRLETLKCHKYKHIKELVIKPLKGENLEKQQTKEKRSPTKNCKEVKQLETVDVKPSQSNVILQPQTSFVKPAPKSVQLKKSRAVRTISSTVVKTEKPESRPMTRRQVALAGPSTIKLKELPGKRSKILSVQQYQDQEDDPLEGV